MRMRSTGSGRPIRILRASASITSTISPTMFFRGNMDTWWDFYRDMFGFKQIHFFDIDGRIHRPDEPGDHLAFGGKIRIPLNESKDENSQIEEYLKKYKGEGIQHIAVGTDGIYDATDRAGRKRP